MQAPGVEAIADRLIPRVGAAAGLDVSLGEGGRPAAPPVARRDRLYQLCHVVDISGVIQLSSGGGTLDVPDLYGPKDGYRWDLRRITMSGFTAGTVDMYRNSTNAAKLAAFTAEGEWTWSGQMWLAPRDRLIFVASSITGNVVIDGNAHEVSEQVLPEYIL